MRSRNRRHPGIVPILLIVIYLVGVIAGSTGGLAADEGAGSGQGENPEVVLEIVARLKHYYVRDVDVASLLKAYLKTGTIKGMLESLKDPYTRYMDRVAFKEMQEDMKGVYEGIGVVIGIKDDRLTIVAPFEGSPGQKAGLKSGDHILHIDGKPTKDMAVEYAATLIRGKKGTSVTLGIERGEKNERFEVKVIREEVKVPHVAGEIIKEKIGYVVLNAFLGEDTAGALDSKLNELQAKGMKGLILDLRYNSGGSLELAVEVASRFVPPGLPVVHIIGRDNRRRTILADPAPKRFNLPMVALVNEGTASASEILCGALQDLKLATIVGVRTFGKGLVQTVFPLSDGSGVSITTDEYLTAGGRAINEKGIEPDVVVKMPEPGKEKKVDVQLEAAIKILEERLRKAA